MKTDSIYFLASISVAYATEVPFKISNRSNMSKESTNKKTEYLPIYDNFKQNTEAIKNNKFNSSLYDTISDEYDVGYQNITSDEYDTDYQNTTSTDFNTNHQNITSAETNNDIKNIISAICNTDRIFIIK
ncbi:hypothetical protein BB561_001093 [Smittium simulii]|uniref:Uncharacterized protein n=1 Tax=Smittium simulii TaxID=133385 RepID=A0A2T9YW95_9FUNG|nr:hypothetical protein BB561_001093 [Smittium simulii]